MSVFTGSATWKAGRDSRATARLSALLMLGGAGCVWGGGWLSGSRAGGQVGRWAGRYVDERAVGERAVGEKAVDERAVDDR